jgi:hypothetical protein
MGKIEFVLTANWLKTVTQQSLFKKILDEELFARKVSRRYLRILASYMSSSA